MSNVVALTEEIRPAPMMAGGRPVAIVPQSMEEAYRLAKAVCMAGMAPKGLDTPEKAMVAIMHGLEVGLTPMAALQRIAVVNGRPTIWGDGAMGLVRGSGACEFIRETIAGEGDNMVATCAAKRKGEPEPIVGVFSVADAKKAQLWGKVGPWQQFPKRMLQMRARAFALRDGFADVLGGLYLREEIEDDARETRRTPPAPPTPVSAAIEAPKSQTASPSPAKTPPAQTAAKVPPAPPPAPPASHKVDHSPFDFDAFRKALDGAANTDAMNAVYDQWVTNRTTPLHPDEIDEADAVLREIGSRLWSGEE